VRSFDWFKRWLGTSAHEIEAEADGMEPTATPPTGSPGEGDRETSTNAQVQGAQDEPWPGNR
jgi:hypothetical protein